jgi:transposase
MTLSPKETLSITSLSFVCGAKYIRELIALHRGIKLSRSAISHLLGHLGLSPQRPICNPINKIQRKLSTIFKQPFLKQYGKPSRRLWIYQG